MAIRVALGARRWRIVQQLLTESILLSAVGGALGLLLAQWGVPLILAINRDAIPRATEINVDLGVLIFTALIAVLTGGLFGLAPAWQASRPDMQSVLKETARNTTGARATLRNGLVVAEIALTMVLLVGAGLLLRSFYQLQQVNAGFTPERVLSLMVDLPERKYATGEQQTAFFQSLQEKLRALPGVSTVGVTSRLPFGNDDWQTNFLIEGRPEPPPSERPSMEVTVASPDYFRAMGISLLRGRYFTEQDNREHLRNRDLSNLNQGQQWGAGLNTAIVDEEFVRRYWPNEDPIGKQIRLPWGATRERQPLLTVVGVVSRVKLGRLDEQGGFVQVYLSALQATDNSRAIVIKTTLEPETLIAAARQQVSALDSEQPIHSVRTMDELVNRSLSPQRLNLILLGGFAAIALLLAAIGLYGVISYAITQRTQEIGIRMALGAQRRDVLRLVIGHGMKLTSIGVGIGAVGALVIMRFIKSLLFGVSVTDPLTFALIAVLLVGVALLACWIPARRASKLDPMIALRYE